MYHKISVHSTIYVELGSIKNGPFQLSFFFLTKQYIYIYIYIGICIYFEIYSDKYFKISKTAQKSDSLIVSFLNLFIITNECSREMTFTHIISN